MPFDRYKALLGGGFVVAPPSVGATRVYEIIKGTLADLDRLPVARIPDEIAKLKQDSHAPSTMAETRRGSYRMWG